MSYTSTITGYNYIPGDQDAEGNYISQGYYEPIYEDVEDLAPGAGTGGGGAHINDGDPTTVTTQTSNTSDPTFWSNLLSQIQTSSTNPNGSASQLAGIAGLAGLLGLSGNNGQQGVYKGYQGGIPNYTASRTMNPIPTTTTIPASGTEPAKTVARRPGQGGIDYFSQMLYKNTPVTTAAAAGTGSTAGTGADTVVVASGGILRQAGGLNTLGGYSDGGRLLRGPGDGVSDSIPATIGRKQPARLADGEFVIPARVVSEIGNGSTEAGARKLYAMMDRVQNARKKSFKNVAANTRADKYLPT